MIGIALTLHAPSASAQTAKDVKGPTPLVAIPNEPAPKLIVDPPIPEQLALGRVFIQYRTENLRILPVFGKAALEVSPRIGHLHCFVDDLSWPIVETSGETIPIVGLPPGPHKVRLELADAIHRPIPGTSQGRGVHGSHSAAEIGTRVYGNTTHQSIGRGECTSRFRKKVHQYVNLNHRSQ